MTQAEYDAISLMIRDLWDNEHVETSWDALDRVISGLIEIFEWDPSFDKDRFGNICTGD